VVADGGLGRPRRHLWRRWGLRVRQQAAGDHFLGSV